MQATRTGLHGSKRRRQGAPPACRLQVNHAELHGNVGRRAPAHQADSKRAGGSDSAAAAGAAAAAIAASRKLLSSASTSSACADGKQRAPLSRHPQLHSLTLQGQLLPSASTSSACAPETPYTVHA
jgi:hypothetical protein